MKYFFVILSFTISLFSVSASEDSLPVVRGLASWYGGQYNGKATASGEIFDMRLDTAAHRDLPFGTELLVTNPANGAAVKVRVNDRGPFVDGRIIDLSKAAAGKIGLLALGVAPVEIQIVSIPPGSAVPQWNSPGGVISQVEEEARSRWEEKNETSPLPGAFLIQVGAFSQIENAQRLKDQVSRIGLASQIVPSNTGIYRVQIPGVSKGEVDGILLNLKSLGISAPLVRKQP